MLTFKWQVIIQMFVSGISAVLAKNCYYVQSKINYVWKDNNQNGQQNCQAKQLPYKALIKYTNVRFSSSTVNTTINLNLSFLWW